MLEVGVEQEAEVVLIHIEGIRRNRNRTDPYSEWGGVVYSDG